MHLKLQNCSSWGSLSIQHKQCTTKEVTSTSFRKLIQKDKHTPLDNTTMFVSVMCYIKAKVIHLQPKFIALYDLRFNKMSTEMDILDGSLQISCLDKSLDLWRGLLGTQVWAFVGLGSDSPPTPLSLSPWYFSSS